MKLALSLLALSQIFQTILCFSSIDFATTTLTANQGFKILGGTPTSWLGNDVQQAGDINKDGIDDFIVTSQFATANSKTQAGAVFVIYGNTAGPAQIDLNNALDLSVGFKISGGSASDFLQSASAAGDFNHDGVDDVIVGVAHLTFNSLIFAGSAYVIYGQQGGLTSHIDLSTLTISQGVQIGGPAAFAQAGSMVRPGGDMNGDGIADVVISATYATFLSRNSAGATYVIYGKQGGYSANIDLGTLDFTVGYKIIGAVANDHFGANIGPGRDLNGDTIPDVLAGTYDAGTRYLVVIWGKQGGLTADVDVATMTISDGIKVTVGMTLGMPAIDAIDFDGDGFKDLIFGTTDTRRVYIIYGVPGGFTQNYDFTSTTYSSSVANIIATDNSFGYSLTCADINGDGYGDIITGNPSYSAGVIFGLSGKQAYSYSTLSSSGQVIKFTPSGSTDNFGYSTAAADVNGDGLPDIIYGSPLEDINGQADAGSVFVIYSSKNDPILCLFILLECTVSNCKICKNALKCTVCNTGYSLYVTNGQCYLNSNCPSTTYSNSIYCLGKIYSEK